MDPLDDTGHGWPRELKLDPARSALKAGTVYSAGPDFSMEARIMETVSENISARKRGRPPVFDESDMEWHASRVNGDKRTGRQFANRGYTMRAVGVLLKSRKRKRFTWLYDEEAERQRKRGACKMIVLSELGRLGDPRLIETFALQLCKLKPKTSAAVAMVRRWRMKQAGKERRPRRRLAEYIIEAVAEYQRRWPDTMDQEALEALQEVTAAFEAALAESHVRGE